MSLAFPFGWITVVWSIRVLFRWLSLSKPGSGHPLRRCFSLFDPVVELVET